MIDRRGRSRRRNSQSSFNDNQYRVTEIVHPSLPYFFKEFVGARPADETRDSRAVSRITPTRARAPARVQRSRPRAESDRNARFLISFLIFDFAPTVG